MAVNVNIPGIGNVTADNAASESTLERLIDAVGKANNSRRRVDNSLEQSFSRQAKAAEEAQISMMNMNKSAGTAASSTSMAMSRIGEGLDSAKSGFSEMMSGATQFGSLMTQTALNIGAEWTRKFQDISISPVNQAASTLNAAIDVAVEGTNFLATSMAKVLPKTLETKLGGGIQKATSIIGGTLKSINNMLSDELNKTVRAQKIFNDAGAVFAGGMSEMRVRAVESGVGIEEFAKIVRDNKDQVKMLGGTIADGATKVTKITGEMAMQQGKSGKTVREELLNMGYSLEDQTKLAIQYAAQTRQLMGTQAFRTVSEKALADGTRKYAEDLKILQEVTGKDAKAVMERARAETMRSSLQSKLNREQSEALTGTFGSLQQFPEEIRGNLQQALIQQLSGGTITDPVVAQSQELTEFIKKLAGGVEAGSGDMVKRTSELSAQLVETMQKQIRAGDGVFVAAGRVAEFGGNLDGNTQKLASFGNAIMGMTVNLGEATRTQENINKTIRSTDPLQESFNKSQIAASDFGKTVGHLASEALPKYAQMIEATTKLTTQTITSTLSFLSGKADLAQFTASIVKSFEEAFKIVFKGTNFSQQQQTTPERRARGGIVETGKNYIVGEDGPELFVAGKDGMILPNTNLKSGLDVDSTKKAMETMAGGLGNAQSALQSQLGAMKGLQENFAATIVTQQKQNNTVQPKETEKTSDNELPDVLSKALEDAFTGPSGFNKTVQDLKNNLETGTQEQISVLREQVTKLAELISVTQDNLRISERIANEMN